MGAGSWRSVGSSKSFARLVESLPSLQNCNTVEGWVGLSNCSMSEFRRRLRRFPMT